MYFNYFKQGEELPVHALRLHGLHQAEAQHPHQQDAQGRHRQMMINSW